MTKKANQHRRAKIVAKIIRQAWSSLDSHLKYTHSHTSEGQQFHKNCVREYVEIIKDASELY